MIPDDPASLPREELVRQVKLLSLRAAQKEELETRLEKAMADLSRHTQGTGRPQEKFAGHP